MAVGVESTHQDYQAALNITRGKRVGQHLHFREQAYEAFRIDHVQGSDGYDFEWTPCRNLSNLNAAVINISSRMVRRCRRSRPKKNNRQGPPSLSVCDSSLTAVDQLYPFGD